MQLFDDLWGRNEKPKGRGWANLPPSLQRALEIVIFGGPVPQATRNDAGEHFAFDANDRGDVRMPFCAGEFFGRIEDRDGAPFVAIAALGTTADRIDRGRC